MNQTYKQNGYCLKYVYFCLIAFDALSRLLDAV